MLEKLLASITGLQILIVLALLGATVVGWCVYARGQKRKARIALLTEGVEVLAHWTYTPEEWRRAREEEFSWASSKDYEGRVYISPTTVYVQSDHRDRLIELADQGKVVTHASYRGADESPLKLRVRWKLSLAAGMGYLKKFTITKRTIEYLYRRELKSRRERWRSSLPLNWTVTPTVMLPWSEKMNRSAYSARIPFDGALWSVLPRQRFGIRRPVAVSSVRLPGLYKRAAQCGGGLRRQVAEDHSGNR